MKNYETLKLKVTNSGKIPVWIDILSSVIRVILAVCQPGVQRAVKDYRKVSHQL